jgi:hypothetical protein
MQIDKEFKGFNLEINGLLALKKIDDYQYHSLLIMKLTQKCLEGIDYKLNDILNKLVSK